MKKLFVCLVILLAAMGIARLRGGVAAMSAADLGVRSAQAGWSHVGVDWDLATSVLAAILQPGAYAISRVGVDPAGDVGLAATVLLCWWGWLIAARLICTVLGRACGLTSAASFHRWLLVGLPWRPIYRIVLRFRRWYRQWRFGPRATAAWTGALAAMTLVFKPGDCVFVGRLWWYGLGLLQPVGIQGPRHIAVVAAAGAGKTRWMMGWLGMIHPKGSAFVIDCDGQMVNSLGYPLECKGHRVFNLDPYGLTRFPCANWNALDEVTAGVRRHGRKAAVRFALTLAEALVREDNHSQPVFSNSARVFLHGLVLYVWLFEPEELRNLVRVRELLTRGMPENVVDPKQDPFDVLLSFMEQSAGFDDECEGKIVAVVARAASVMRSGKGRDGNPFRSTAISQTAWLDLPEIEAISRRSDFVGEDLKTGNPCVFVCLPVVDIQTKLAGYVRALTMMTLYAFQNMPGRLKIPCAFCLDEFPSLGRIEALETAAPVFRKYGVRLVTITQDLERLRQVYPQSWGGFIGNSQATLWMSTDHQQTLEHLSNVLGVTTYIEELSSGWFSNVPARMERRERPLMAPDQLREFLDPERGQFIVTRTGKPPLRVSYEGYDKALSIFDYDPDLNFREPILRAATRSVANWLVPRKPQGRA